MSFRLDAPEITQIPDSIAINPINTIETGPSIAGRILMKTTRLLVRPALQAGCYAAHLPWPYEALEFAARAIPKPLGTSCSTIDLRHATADLICARGVGPRTGRVILYLHGGAFLICGPNTHAGLITRLSKASNAPVLAVNYRMIPDNSVVDAVQDCLDAYYWLRENYQPEQIVLAGDSAGGYLALAVANCLLFETPAALVMLSPLLQLDPTERNRHPNMRCDAIFGREAFEALYILVERANGGTIYEPLDNLHANLPPTLIHVSGHEALLHDARLAAQRLSRLEIPVEVRAWPGQIHVFQIAPLLPEARRSLQQIGEYIMAATTHNQDCDSNGLTYPTGAVG